MKYSILSALIALALVQTAGAQEKPQLVRVPVQVAFVPQAFDSNDTAQIVVEGYLPSSCHKLGPIETFVDKTTGVVRVEQFAYFHNVLCNDMIVPFQQEVTIGLLNKGAYKVQDTESGKLLGSLPITRALKSQPDDFMYATVRDAYVLPQTTAANTAHIEGFFSNSCSRIKEMRVIQESATVVTVLPIVERIPSIACAQVLVPFRKEVQLPQMRNGRHLLHVRSLNGQAVNKLFDIRQSPAR